MPSRRSSASTSPRFVQAAACRTIRSFSDAENDRLLPRLGTLSTETPLGRGAAPDAEGAGAAATEPGGGGSAATATPPERGAAPGAAGAGVTDRRREGLGTGQVHPPPSLHRFREEAVSAHVGTGGPGARGAPDRYASARAMPRGPNTGAGSGPRPTHNPGRSPRSSSEHDLSLAAVHAPPIARLEQGSVRL